jgi:hypothetical protein
MSQYEIPERHERVIRALQAGGPAAPETLWIVREAKAPARTWWRPPAYAALAAAVAVAVVVTVLAITGAGRTDFDQLSAMATQPATQPTPASEGALLDRSFEGVAFPDWTRDFGWMADGARTDTVDGRETSTVFYTHHGHRIAYTVVGGEPLEPTGETLQRDGVEIHRFTDGDRTVVTFERGGRTCVIAGHVMDPDTLVKLAAWQGDGAVRF